MSLKDSKVTDDMDGTEIKDDKDYRDADFEIITSDKVPFRVHSYYLLAHSGVFRDGHDTVSKDDKAKLEFTDTTIESSTVFRRFLLLIHKGHLDTDKALSGIIDLVSFMRKYEATMALSTLLSHVRDQVNSSMASPHNAFTVGAAADSEETCRVALKVTNWVWSHEIPRATKADSNQGPSLNPYNWSFLVWQRTPPDYLWSLNCAWVECGQKPELGETFSTYLAITRK